MRGSVVVVGLFVCFTMKEYVYIVRCFYIFQRCRSLNPEEKGLKGLSKFSGKKKKKGYRKLVKWHFSGPERSRQGRTHPRRKNGYDIQSGDRSVD